MSNTTTDQTALLAQIAELKLRSDALEAEARAITRQIRDLIDAEANRLAVFKRGEVVTLYEGKKKETHVITRVHAWQYRGEIRLDHYRAIRLRKDGTPRSESKINSWKFSAAKSTGEYRLDLINDTEVAQ